MQLKRATSLVVSIEPQGIVVHNFLTKNIFSCNASCIDFINHASEWKTLESVYKTLAPYFDHEVITSNIVNLLKNNALIIRHSELATLDNNYSTKWEWGSTAGCYHFSTRNVKYLAGPEQRLAIRKRRSEKAEPAAIKDNDAYKTIIRLPRFNVSNHLFKVMRERRSNRDFENNEISLDSLSDCLFSAKGITRWLEDDDFGRLPLTMTPSGGARNPYELYIYAHSVSGLSSGFYHYSGQDHNLGRINDQTIIPADILANQEWANDAAAIIFLTANFSRTSWKYNMPPAYKIVLIEAGFIAQNIALSATHHGLSAVPTGAVSESKIETYLQLESVSEAHILSLVIGKPLTQ